MLGEWVHDSQAIESAAGSSAGLHLLAMETTLTDHKTLSNVQGVFCHDHNIGISGYEIHAGVSQGDALALPLLRLRYSDNESDGFTNSDFYDGAISPDNSVMGSYIHGFFDHNDALNYCLQWLGVCLHRDGTLEPFDYLAHKEAEIERLADEVEKVLPLATLLGLLGLDPDGSPKDTTCAQ